MRERLLLCVFGYSPFGITPACAGKTRASARFFLCSRDHPRVCGKDTLQAGLGSCERRITPACAGKTHCSCIPAFNGEDHPRVCGKDSASKYLTTLAMGSPPRVRERRFDRHGHNASFRITPACAGKTLYQAGKSRRQRDHPRVCGKDLGCHKVTLRPVGSPPRVRERLSDISSKTSTVRITPACAGKTAQGAEITLPPTDHPRVCGKDHRPTCHITKRIGSPPRVRERPYYCAGMGRGNRITPACAGKTSLP